MKIRRGQKKFCQNRTNISDTLVEHLSVFHVVGCDICCAAIQRRHSCVSMAIVVTRARHMLRHILERYG